MITPPSIGPLLVFQVMAVVISTGYMTAKGSLVSAIMYPPPVDFEFERDSYRFIGFLILLAVLGLTYNLILMVSLFLTNIKKLDFNCNQTIL